MRPESWTTKIQLNHRHQRELRARHHWRFHRQHRTWFQRYAEPAEVTEEGERGSVVYFDESDWTPKVAANFLFSYADLCEDVTV